MSKIGRGEGGERARGRGEMGGGGEDETYYTSGPVLSYRRTGRDVRGVVGFCLPPLAPELAGWLDVWMSGHESPDVV